MFSPAKLALFVLLAACSVGEVPSGGGADAGMNPNQATFASTIAPLVTECIPCHTGTPPNFSSFMTLEARHKMKPGSGNILVTKDNLDGTPGTHKALPYFSAAEEMTVINWIDNLQP